MLGGHTSGTYFRGILGFVTECDRGRGVKKSEISVTYFMNSPYLDVSWEKLLSCQLGQRPTRLTLEFTVDYVNHHRLCFQWCIWRGTDTTFNFFQCESFRVLSQWPEASVKPIEMDYQVFSYWEAWYGVEWFGMLVRYGAGYEKS